MTQQSSQPVSSAFTKATVSAVILAIASMQAYAAFLRMPCNSIQIPGYCALPNDPGLYPFLDYPMYSRTKAEGAQVNQYVLTATFANGEAQPLTAEDFDLSAYWFKNGLMDAFRAENYAKIKKYVTTYETIHDRDIDSLRLESTPLKITREGIIEQPSKLVLEVPQTLLKGESITGESNES